MPIHKRKRTIRGAVRDVLIAPIAFLFVGIFTNYVWLLLIAILLPLCIWMENRPLGNLQFSLETVYIGLGVAAVVALAAVPLAVKDYFSNGGYEVVWKPSEETVHAAQYYADAILASNYGTCYEHFSDSLQDEWPLPQFLATMANLKTEVGPPVETIDVRELEIAEQVFSDPDWDLSMDAVVQISFRHQTTSQSIMTLYLNSRESFQITMLDITMFDITPEHRATIIQNPS